MTTSDYLEQLEQDREDLVDNLETQGITGLTGDETFTELVPEVLNISGGGVEDYFESNMTNKSTFKNYIKKTPPITITLTANSASLNSFYESYQDLTDVGDITIVAPNNASISMERFFASNNKLTKVPKVVLSNQTSKITSASNFLNGCTNITDYSNLSLLDFSNATSVSSFFSDNSKLETCPLIDTSNSQNFMSMHSNNSKLVTAPSYNTSEGANFNNMFSNCSRLENVPIYDWEKAIMLSSVFFGCTVLTDASLDNILQSCISATTYTGTKTLYYLGIRNTTIYPNSRIEALPHYQDFINAGWTTGNN